MSEPFDPNFPLELSFTVDHSECLCGSGKRPEKCCGHRPRNYSLAMDIRNFVEADGLALYLKDMTVERRIGKERYPLLGASRLRQGYTRNDKADKSLIETVLKTRGSFEPNALFLEYDHIFAIDTNTRQLEDQTISLACVIHAFIENESSEGYLLKYGPIGFFDCRNPHVSAEQLGWMILSRALRESSDFKEKEIGIIVDSAIDQLDSYNKHNAPIVPGYFLPDNHKLIYASADNGTTIANKLIKKCDKRASAALREIIEKSHHEGLQNADQYPCDLFRQLTPNAADPAWLIQHKAL